MADPTTTMEQQANQTMEKAKRAVERAKKTDVRGAVKAAAEAHQTAAAPLYLGLTGGSVLLSLILYGFKKREASIFVGLWAPTFMGLGLMSQIASLRNKEQT